MGLDLEQSALVFALGEALRNRGSWAGETHIQKAGYFLQELLKVPLRFTFILYKHGPFSFELHDTIAAMESERIISWQPQPYPYGPSMVPGPLSSHLAKFASSAGNCSREIDFVADHLASKKVVDLERLATALYVTLDRKVASERRAEELTFRKPHIKLPDAEEAVKEVDGVLTEAINRGFVRKVAAANSSAFQIQRSR